MSIWDDAGMVWGEQGPPGAATVEQVGDLEARVAAREAITIPTVLNDLTDVSGTPTTGQLLQYDGTGWVPYTPAATVVPFMVPFLSDGGGATIATGTKGFIRFNFSADILSWSINNVPIGSITYDINKNGTSIVGTNPPKVTSSDGAIGDVTGWTSTSVADGDTLAFDIDSATTSTLATLTLYMQREL